jgi:hypothetical protein
VSQVKPDVLDALVRLVDDCCVAEVQRKGLALETCEVACAAYAEERNQVLANRHDTYQLLKISDERY